MESPPTLIRCNVTVSMGIATARYLFEGNSVEGAQRHDEDVSTWSDVDVRELFRDLLGVSNSDADKIEVDWE